jgi:hypothetical protein
LGIPSEDKTSQPINHQEKPMQYKTETPLTLAIYKGISPSPARAILTTSGEAIISGMTAGEALAALKRGGRRIVTTGENY